jgi:transcriptional regulator with XRE-family HTH domain
MLATRIKLARKRKHLSQAALGKRLAPPVSRAAVSQWETGDTTPTHDNLTQIAEELDVSVPWLLGQGDNDDADAVKPHFDAEPSAAPLDRGLMALVVRAVYDYMETERIGMSPADFAELILTAYDWADEERQLTGDPADINWQRLRWLFRVARTHTRPS